MSVGSSGSDYDLLAAPVTPSHSVTEEKQQQQQEGEQEVEEKKKDDKKEIPRLFFAGE